MHFLGQLLTDIAQFCVTEALCIGAVSAAILGLVALALLVKACDPIPDRRPRPPGRVKTQKPSALLF